MKKFLLLTATLLIGCVPAVRAQMKKHPVTYIKCHYFFELYDNTIVEPHLNRQNNITLILPKNIYVNIGDTIVITYMNIPEKWLIYTGEDAKKESCFRCNSPYFEEYKVIVINKIKK